MTHDDFTNIDLNTFDAHDDLPPGAIGMASFRGFADWNPMPRTKAMVDAIAAALNDPNDLGALGTVSIRAVYYWAVTRRFVDKDEAGYRTVKKAMGRARRASIIDFNRIVDNGIMDLTPNVWTGTHQVINTARHLLSGKDYLLDRQNSQPARTYLWTEALGSASGQAQIANRYGVPVVSSGGQPSLTFVHNLAQRMVVECKAGNNQSALILQVGDWDSRGLSLVETTGEDIVAFAGSLGSLPVKVERIAVTEQQIIARNLPTGTQKQSDTTARSFVGVNGDGITTCEVDALPPPELRDIVESSIRSRMDMDLLQQIEDQEEVDKDFLRTKADLLDDTE